MTFHFAPEALDEYRDAIAYYRGIRWELGQSFVEEVERGIERILEHPRANSEVDEDIRRHLIRRFPYGLFYTIENGDSIWIVAVGHLKRQPGYWRDRIP